LQRGKPQEAASPDRPRGRLDVNGPDFGTVAGSTFVARGTERDEADDFAGAARDEKMRRLMLYQATPHCLALRDR
jgi:hypothetical protein